MGQGSQTEKRRRAPCLILRRRLEGAPFRLCPGEERHTRVQTRAATSLPTHGVRKPGRGACLHVNLLSASSLLLLAGADWPLSRSRESTAEEDVGSLPQSCHLAPRVIHKTRASQGWRLRGVWPRSLCGVRTVPRAHPGSACTPPGTRSSLPREAAHCLCGEPCRKFSPTSFCLSTAPIFTTQA